MLTELCNLVVVIGGAGPRGGGGEVCGCEWSLPDPAGWGGEFWIPGAASAALPALPVAHDGAV